MANLNSAAVVVVCNAIGAKDPESWEIRDCAVEMMEHVHPIAQRAKFDVLMAITTIMDEDPHADLPCVRDQLFGLC